MPKPKMSEQQAQARKQELAAEAERIRDISVKVYKLRLCQESGEDAVGRMLARDEEKQPGCGEKLLRNRAASYDPLTRAYLLILAKHLAL